MTFIETKNAESEPFTGQTLYRWKCVCTRTGVWLRDLVVVDRNGRLHVQHNHKELECLF